VSTGHLHRITCDGTYTIFRANGDSTAVYYKRGDVVRLTAYEFIQGPAPVEPCYATDPSDWAKSVCETMQGSAATTYTTKDSGQREEMPTGSVRDSREGKGRFDLITPFALARVAGVYERGAKKYADRNWEKGQSFSRFLDSALRHLNRFQMGWEDEDHLSQAAWNILAIIHFQECVRRGIGDYAQLDDMPHYESGPKETNHG
jgi:hypothetical protein